MTTVFCKINQTSPAILQGLGVVWALLSRHGGPDVPRGEAATAPVGKHHGKVEEGPASPRLWVNLRSIRANWRLVRGSLSLSRWK